MVRKLNGTEIRERLFRLLCMYADVCESHGLKYSLCGGTLLGAVRHQGFIPWDDDLDVFMPREDYDSLRKISGEEGLPAPYRMISPETGDCILPYAKIIDEDTRVQSELMYGDTALWIDIFPVEKMPDQRQEALDILLRAHALKIDIGRSLAVTGKGSTKLRAFFKLPLLAVPKLRGAGYYRKKIMELAGQCRQYSGKVYIGAVSWSCGEAELLPADTFMHTVPVMFEGREFSAIRDWDMYLRHMYGEYMRLPDKDRRESHHMEVILQEGEKR